MKDMLIEKVCRKVLLEYMGVSDDVSEMAQELYDTLVYGAVIGHEWEPKTLESGAEVYVKELRYDRNYLSNYKVGQYIRNFEVDLYGYDSDRVSFRDCYEYLHELGDTEFSFYPDTREIVIKMPYPFRGILDDKSESFVRSVLDHEMKHAYQYGKRGHDVISDEYSKAIEKMDWDTDESSTIKCLRNAAKRCYYVFNSDEIDANIQGIWSEMINGVDLKDCNGYFTVTNAIDEYKFVRKIVFPTDDFYEKCYVKEREMFKDILKREIGNITVNQWERYCERGIKKFNDQLRRIMGRFIETFGNNNEGSFSRYARNEIPQGERFVGNKAEKPKRKRTVWDKIKGLGIW